MQLDTVKLRASFKIDGSIPEGLFSTYKEILNYLLSYACEKGITSIKKLRSGKNYDARQM